MRRLLFYAVDGLGLGHVTRLLALARAVRQQSPDAEILFLTASEASHVIYREGFAALKVPSRAAAATGHLRHGSFVRLTQSVVWNAVTAFDPHCLVVDTFAAGALHELLPILRWPLRKVFIFRAQRAERAADPLLQSTLRLYDLILVPHHPGSENIPAPDSSATVWTGPMLLRARDELLDRAAARTALGLPVEGEIGLITLGGGGEPETLTAREQLRRALATIPHQTLWVEVAGPLLRAAPENGSAESDWQVLRDIYPLMPYLRAFDCAVSAVGYNTTHELQAAGIPSLLWPFTRDLDDQSSRAQRLARAGRALAMGEGTGIETEGENRVPELTGALQALLQPATRAQLRHAMDAAQEHDNGATVGAIAILKLLNI